MFLLPRKERPVRAAPRACPARAVSVCPAFLLLSLCWLLAQLCWWRCRVTRDRRVQPAARDVFGHGPTGIHQTRDVFATLLISSAVVSVSVCYVWSKTVLPAWPRDTRGWTASSRRAKLSPSRLGAGWAQRPGRGVHPHRSSGYSQPVPTSQARFRSLRPEARCQLSESLGWSQTEPSAKPSAMLVRCVSSGEPLTVSEPQGYSLQCGSVGSICQS